MTLRYTRKKIFRNLGRTQNNLGFALQQLGNREGNRTQLEAAVDAYKMALEVFTQEDFPLDWARDPEQSGRRAYGTGEARG